jgi:hypothetical protein
MLVSNGILISIKFCFGPVPSHIHNIAMCVKNVKLRGLLFCGIGWELDYVVLHLGTPGVKPNLSLAFSSNCRFGVYVLCV